MMDLMVGSDARIPPILGKYIFSFPHLSECTEMERTDRMRVFPAEKQIQQTDHCLTTFVFFDFFMVFSFFSLSTFPFGSTFFLSESDFFLSESDFFS